MNTPAILYQSAARTDARPCGKPRYKYPLPAHCPIQLAAYQFDQDFEMLLSSFPPAAKNTPASHSNGGSFTFGGLSDAHAILVGYSQPTSNYGGLGRFTATFARVPASWDDFQEIPFTFPGFPGVAGGTDVRDIFTDTVRARVRYDYFLVDPDNLAAGVQDSAGAAITRYTSLSAIPQISKSYFVAAPGGVAQPATRTNSITPAGGIVINGVQWNETLPNLALYKAWAAKAVTSGWTSTAWDGVATVPATVGQIIAQDSHTEPYAGNIVSRATIYILVK